MKKYILLLCFVTLCSARLSSQISGSIQFEGLTRTYLLYIPASYTNQQHWPLLFVLHGFTQNADAIMNITGFNTLADSEKFIVVYPNGVSNAWNTNSGFPGGSTANDVGFVEALIDLCYAQYNIDTTRVYACGFSAGGYMSHRLACESKRCFASIVSVSGTMSSGAQANCHPERPTSVLQIHGTADAIVAYNGSVFSGISVDAVLDTWRTANHCTAAPVISTLPDLNTSDNSTVEKTVYGGCDDQRQVILMKVINGGHAWPGTSVATGGIGTINLDIDASRESWHFLRAYQCGQLPLSATAPSSEPLQIVPNPGNGLFSLTVPASMSGVLRISVWNSTGIRIKSRTGPTSVEKTIDLDLTGAPAGLYFVQLQNGSQAVLARLVVID